LRGVSKIPAACAVLFSQRQAERSAAAFLSLQTMQKFSTVKNACDSLSQITGKYYSFKYELLHGKRFYFVHVEQELPFNIRQFSLVCRGDKQTVISKLQIIAGNQPTF
jgi:hypothetical protein